MSLIRIALACLAVSATIGKAQQVTSATGTHTWDGRNSASIQTLGIRAQPNDHALSAHTAPTSFVGDSATARNPAKYVVVGAAIGGVTLGGLALLQISHCARTDSCMFAGPFASVVTGAGLVLGAFVGWLAYRATS